MIIYKDEKFRFCEIFNEENGTLIRSDINGIEPVMRSFPELLDVGIVTIISHVYWQESIAIRTDIREKLLICR